MDKIIILFIKYVILSYILPLLGLIHFIKNQNDFYVLYSIKIIGGLLILLSFIIQIITVIKYKLFIFNKYFFYLQNFGLILLIFYCINIYYTLSISVIFFLNFLYFYQLFVIILQCLTFYFEYVLKLNKFIVSNFYIEDDIELNNIIV